MVHTALRFVDGEGLGRTCASPVSITLALWLHDEKLVSELLTYHPDLDVQCRNDFRLTPLQAACAFGCSRSLLTTILEVSKSATLKDEISSGLILLASQGYSSQQYGVVEELLEAGFDPNGVSEGGRTAVMNAARTRGRPDMLRQLLDNGASPLLVAHNGWNAVHYAIERGRFGALYILREVEVYWKKKISIELCGMTYYEATALHLAAGLDDFDTLDCLLHLDTCPNVDETTEDGNTALHVAAWTGISGDIVSLLARDADPTRKNSKHGATPLHTAARYGHREAVSAFIDYGCALGCADRYGLTPALHALKNGHEDIASALDNDVL